MKGALPVSALCVSLATAFAAPLLCGEPAASVAVESGVPCAKFAGKELPHLIFAGSNAGAPSTLAVKEWTKIEYSCVAPLDDAQAVVQVNFGSGKGRVSIRSLEVWEDGGPEGRRGVMGCSFKDASWSELFRLVDAKSSGAKALSAGPEGLELEVPKRMEFPWDVQLLSVPLVLREGRKYRVSFEMKGSFEGWPVSSYLMRFNPLRFYARSGKDMFKATAALALANGAEAVSPAINAPWTEKEEDFEREFKLVARDLDMTLEAFPSAKLVLRLGAEPPAWWRKAHPEELESWEDGGSSNYVCVASKLWLEESRRHLKRCVAALEERYGSSVVAYMPVAQSTGEWYYPVWDKRSSGAMNFAKPFQKAFRGFLEERYGSVEALNKAWGSSFQGFDAIAVPSGAERETAKLGVFRDPASQRRLFDFGDFQRKAMSDALENAASAVKEASGGRKLVLAFYGYLFEHAGILGGLEATGHLDLGRALRSKNLDCVVDIVSYSDRGARGSGCLMSASESILSHGKLLCAEDDSRTHLSSRNAGYERTATPEETSWAQSRNLLRSLVHNGYTWKFDLYGAGWFDDAALWKDLGTLLAAYEKRPKRPLKSEIAVIVDERSMLALKPGIELSRPLLFELRQALARSGAMEPGFWLLDDFIEGRVPKAKILIFPNAFYLDSARRAALLKRCSENGGAALWLYAPGYLSPEGASLQAMKELTGFEFKEMKRASSKGSERLLAAKEADAFMKLDGAAMPSLAKGVSEYFEAVPASPSTTPLGLFPEGGVALAATKHGSFQSVFCAAPSLSPRFLSRLFEGAGVWLYAPPGTVVLSDGRLLGVCSPEGGVAPLSLPEGVSARSLDGKTVFEGGKPFDVEFKPGETKIFQLKGEPNQKSLSKID